MIALSRFIIDSAKSHLGRPYGFFDNPALGDTDRLYCSEFVLSTFRQARQEGFDLVGTDRVEDLSRYWSKRVRRTRGARPGSSR